MRLSPTLAGRRVYLDANFFIYVVELYRPVEAVVREAVRMLDTGEMTGVTSALTLAEVLPGPRRAGNASIEARYRELISDQSGLRVEPISVDVLLMSVDVRAEGNLMLIDAIHVATARLAGCDYILTNDKALGLVTRPPVLLIDSLDA